jgi:hypothetical protein
MTATIKNIFTRTQFVLLASLLALVFSFSLSAEAATANIDLTINPSDSSIEWVGIKGVTYRFYFDGSKTETKLKEGKSIFAALGNKRGTFTLTPGAHTVTAVGKDAKGNIVSTSAPTAFFAGFEVPKPKVGIPTGESSSRNIYPFMAKAVSSTQVDLTFNCVVPNADHSCKIYQDGKLIKSFEVKTKDYGRYTTYSVKNLTPNTKYSFVVVGSAKKGSLPDKPTVNTFTYTPTLSLKTPATSVVIPPTTPSMKVISPNGKETYKTGDVMTIKWNTGDTTKIKNVRISLLYKENDPSDTRLFEGTVVESVPNTGSYTWKIGERYARGMQKGEFSIGVGKAEVNYIAVDYSDDPFTINPGTKQTKLTVTSPKKGQVVKSNEEMLITWNVERDAGVRADLFRISDEGFMRNLDVRGTGAKEGLFATLPQDIRAEDDYFVRVAQGAVDEEIGYSEPFSIVAPVSCAGVGCTKTITVLTPNGGERWDEGVLNTVTWSPYSYDSGSNSRKDVNPARDVTAYLEKKDDGGNFITLGKVQESGKASIHWIAGELNSASRGGDYALPGEGYYIRVVNNKTGATDRSDKPFTLLPKPIKIKVNGKEDWVEIPNVKTPITVSWETTPGATACHLYGMKGISESAIQPGKGSVTGLVDYKKNISSDNGEIFYSYGVGFYCTKNGNTIKDYARFSITSLSEEGSDLKILSPDGGEQLDVNELVIPDLAIRGLNSISVALYKNDKWFTWIAKDIDVSVVSDNYKRANFTPAALIPKVTTGEKVYKLYVTGQRADGEGYIEGKSDAPFSFVANSASSEGLELGSVIDGTGSSDSTQVVSGVNPDLNYGVMFLEYEITPFGDDMFVKANNASRGSSKTAGVSYTIEDTNGNVIPTGTVSLTYDIDGADEENGYFHLEEGESYTMIVTVNSFNPIATGNYQLQVLSVGSSPVAGGAVTQNVPSDLSDYESDDVVIQSNTPATPPKTPSTPSVNDTTPPTMPSNLKGVANSGTHVSLSWSSATDAGGSGLVGYAIYRNDADKQIGFSTTTSFFDSSRTPATPYVYKVSSLDKAGNESSKASVSVKTLTLTATPVLAPTCTLTANKSSYVLGETITYKWTSTNATYAGWQQDTSGKDHLLLPGDKLPANGTQAVPASVTGNPPVTLTVGGVGGTGSCSLTVAVTSPTPTPVVTVDKTVPSVPASAAVANLAAVSGSGWSADLSWGASTDNVGVTGYVVKRIVPTVAELTTTTGKTFKLTGLTVGGEYTVSVQAKDARGNLGPARVVKFKLNFTSMGSAPTLQIISNTVDTAVQKVVAQAPNPTPLTGAEQSTKIETLTVLMNKLIELKAMMASVKMSR